MRAEAWEGFDFLTIDSGINPLIASYSGAPFQARGVDPSETAKASVALWNGLGATSSGLPDLLPHPSDDTLKKVGFGAVGSLLAIVLIALGIVIIWKG